MNSRVEAFLCAALAGLAASDHWSRHKPAEIAKRAVDMALAADAAATALSKRDGAEPSGEAATSIAVMIDSRIEDFDRRIAQFVAQIGNDLGEVKADLGEAKAAFEKAKKPAKRDAPETEPAKS